MKVILLVALWPLLESCAFVYAQTTITTQADLSACGEACVNQLGRIPNGCSILDNECNCKYVKDCAMKRCNTTESVEASNFINPFCKSLSSVLGDNWNTVVSAQNTPTRSAGSLATSAISTPSAAVTSKSVASETTAKWGLSLTAGLVALFI